MSIEAGHSDSSTLNAHDMSEDYQYTPLEDPKIDLRLVEILPGLPNDSLKCNIRTCHKQLSDQRDPRGYRALSYTWGDTSIKVPISLNSKRFFITPNLEAALRAERSPPEAPRTQRYWIDAMCIDQQNTDERDEQVRRMKDVYERASHVLIWLGECHEPIDDGFRLSKMSWGLENLERGDHFSVLHAFCIIDDIAELYNIPPGDEQLRKKRVVESYPQDHWAQLARLFHRTWFERLWIIQELGAAREPIVLCGRHRVSWWKIENAAAWIIWPGVDLPQRILKILPRMGAHRVKQVSLQSMLSVDPKNILTVLHNTQEAKCTDPRDRLYAILGVVEDNEDIDIDYSIPVQTVYRNWAERRIRRTGLLDVLGACADSGRSGDLPSWVPDLRRPWGQDKSLWVQSRSKNAEIQLQSSAGVDELLFSKSGMRLAVIGQRLDSVTCLSSMGDVATNFRDPTTLKHSLLGIIENWQIWARDRGGLSEAGERSFHEVILRLFPLDWTDYQNARQVQVYETWRGSSAIITPYEKSFVGTMTTTPETDREFERSLFPKIHGCQMFLTQSGNFGAVAGNCQTQIGDELWVLNRGLTPFVLRRTDQVHRVISPCYLAGHMTGFRGLVGKLLGARKYNELEWVTLV